MITLENDALSIDVNPKGAELSKFFSKTTGLEYQWDGDPVLWAGRSPVLFPIVGTLKHDTYYHNGKKYHLPRHGFARNMMFEKTSAEKHSVGFSLKSSADTLDRYPFPFQLEVIHRLSGPMISVRYRVTNTGSDTMYFSIGGHPAFCIPFEKGLKYSDYYFEFSDEENAGRWPLSHEGLVEAMPTPLLEHRRKLPLNRDLFVNNAIILKRLNSKTVRLKTDRSPHGLEFHFGGFPFLGLWSAKDADFVCIEPWCGLADSVNADQQLIHKEGIEILSPAQVFEREWSVTVF
ncbi:MAG TPA: aldose 1-epimerase family protein [Flavitalea sp.]|nr:aldose 1-epimerase family protein [Flavitalea sp.]